MSELPTGWTIANIGEINAYKSETIDPSKFVSKTFELYSVPSFPTHSPEILEGKEIGSTKQKVKPDDVLLCKINPRINRVWVVGEKAEHEQIASSEWIVLRQPQLDSNFIRYQLRESDFRERLCAEVSGVGGSLTRAQPKKVEGYALRIAPLAEQKRIAQKLDALLAQVDTLKARIDAIPALLKRFRQSVLTAATNGDLSETWRRQQGAHEEWRHVRLADVASDFSYGSASKSSKEGAVPVLRMGNIQNCRIDWSDLAFTSDDHEIDRYRLDDGDVLFNRTNSPQLVGKTAVFKGQREAIFAGYLIRIRCSPHLAPDFLNYCLGSPAGRAYCWQVKSDGVSQSNINAKKLAAFSFRLPPIEEQQEIIRSVEQLFAFADQIEAKVETAQKRIDALTQSLLAKAFRGELVPQDPSDEPASVLLERIRAQRAATPKPKRGRKAATS